ncbi:MAG TPA: cysteine desulfurase family protein [Oceanipulchritudo sp.]|nr:cysteine desulfurase family protein [Oceanipulchritudo sp.]
MLYFDWNATAPLLPAAREAWIEADEKFWANPSTPYRMGVQARLALDEARETVASLMGVEPGQVIFTSGATEGNNGLVREAARRAGPEAAIWISAVEHPSIREAAKAFWGTGRVVQIPVTQAGVVDLDWIRDRIKGMCPAVVCVMAVNNETGVIQPVGEIARLCREAGVAYFCDAVQWMGKQPDAAGICQGSAAVVASGHKFGGPKGTGFVILGPEWQGLKFQFGGSQELDSRAGTENLPGILAMVAALKARCELKLTTIQREARDRFEDQLLAMWPGEVVIHGRGTPRNWNTLLVSLPRHKSGRWISRLDRLGFQVSSGSACSAGKAGPSLTLHAMGVDPDTASRTVRISSGWETPAEAWAQLLESIRQALEDLDAAGPADGPGQVITI